MSSFGVSGEGVARAGSRGAAVIRTDAVTADRVRRISVLSEDIAGRPNVGPYEMGVLEELLGELRLITGLD